MKVVDAGVADAEVSPGRRGERHEASDLDVVGADAVLGAPELVAAVDGHHVRADAVDLRAHLHEQAGEVLDVRLRRGVLKIVVGPGVRAAAISAFSVPITDGSSMKTAAGLEPADGGR